jgi:hypothetical protein
MEEVFKDVFSDFQDEPTDKLTRGAYIDLIDLYLRVLRETTNWLCEDSRIGAPIGRLLAEAASRSDELTVITFNHDLVIENEIYRRAQLRGRWCLDQGYGTLSSSLGATRPTASVPVFGLHGDDCNHSRPIRLLKLHGSLNWVVRINSARPTANLLSGRASHMQVQLLIKRQILGREAIVRGPAGRGRGRSHWNTWPVVVPPVHAKQALREVVAASWSDARQALETAERIAFFGYSLPGLDAEAERLFKRSLLDNGSVPWIDVINPGPASAARFADVSSGSPIHWYANLGDFVDSGAFA